MKFPVKVFSIGQPQNIRCGGGGQFSVTEEEEVIVWKLCLLDRLKIVVFCTLNNTRRPTQQKLSIQWRDATER